MEDVKRCHIPAFGHWDYQDDLPFTQYFESAPQGGLGLLDYKYYGAVDHDLYGDAFKKYTFAIASPPKTKETASFYVHSVETKKHEAGYQVIEQAKATRAAKAVDEDLYKIPPDLLRTRHKGKLAGFLACLVPVCSA